MVKFTNSHRIHKACITGTYLFCSSLGVEFTNSQKFSAGKLVSGMKCCIPSLCYDNLYILYSIYYKIVLFFLFYFNLLSWWWAENFCEFVNSGVKCLSGNKSWLRKPCESGVNPTIYCVTGKLDGRFAPSVCCLVLIICPEGSPCAVERQPPDHAKPVENNKKAPPGL